MQHLAASEGQQLAGKSGGSFGLFTDSRKSVCNLGSRAILLETEFRPSQNGADNVVEIVRDTSCKLPDGFKFLRLPQLALHGPQLGDVLSNNFDGPGKTGDRKHTDVESHSHDATIAPPPFGFDAFHLSMFAARSH